jgi:hypothetical protein
VENSSKLEIRNYHEGDEQKISKLLYDSFPNTLDIDSIYRTWKWQFKNSFTATPFVSVAEAGAEIAAQYAVMKLPMIYKLRLTEGAISTATATDARFRGRGLFTKLAQALYEEIKKDGCQIIFGFPNKQSFHGFVSRLGWFEIGAFPLHLRIIDPFPFFKKFLGDNILSNLGAKIFGIANKSLFRERRKVGDDYTIKPCPPGELPDGLEALLKESSISDRISVVRDSRYLEWRYLEKPFFTYEIYTVTKQGALCGYFVIYVAEKLALKTVYVMECSSTNDSSEIYSAMLRKLDEIALERKADSISMLLMQNHPQYRLFRRSGFIRVPKKLLPQKIYFAAKVLSEKIDTTYARDPKNWYITWGDLDVI